MRREGAERTQRAERTTVYFFWLPVLLGNTACPPLVPFGRGTFTAPTSSQARKRRPWRVDHLLREQTTATPRQATARSSRGLGHRVGVRDGSGFFRPATLAWRRQFGPPGGQRPGGGFPVARGRALFDVATGLRLRTAGAPGRPTIGPGPPSTRNPSCPSVGPLAPRDP